MLKCFLTLVLAGMPLWAQSSWGGITRIGPITSTRELNQRLSAAQPAAVVVLDAPDQGWAQAFRGLNLQAPLAELDLDFLEVAQGSEAGEYLSGRNGWNPGAHWTLMDSRGRVIAHGTSLPTAEGLKEAFEHSALQSRLERLRRFVKENPDQTEGRMRLVRKLKGVAERRTLAHLGQPPLEKKLGMVHTFGNSEGYEFRTPPTVEEALARRAGKELTRETDEAIWGEYAQELARLLEDDSWAALVFTTSYKQPFEAMQFRLDSPLARFSPLCQETYRRLLPRIEALIRRFPSAGYPLQTWAGFAKTAKTPLNPFLDELDPMPLTQDWPPIFLRRALMDEARKRGNWADVAEMAKRHWEELQDTLRGEEQFYADSKRKEGLGVTPWLNEYQWESLTGPYVEALLMLGRSEDAEGLLSQWSAHQGWSGAYLRAAQLAEKAEQLPLAERWRRLAPGKDVR